MPLPSVKSRPYLTLQTSVRLRSRLLTLTFLATKDTGEPRWLVATPSLSERLRPLLWALLGAVVGAFLAGTAAVTLGLGLTDPTLKHVQDVANVVGFCLGAPVGYFHGKRRALRPPGQQTD